MTKSFSLRSRLTRVAVAATAAAAVAAGVSVAAIPGADGKIQSCYGPGGKLRVIDPSAGHKCNATEKPLAWNQTGPAGPMGPAGPKGATGAPGPAGPSFARGHWRVFGETTVDDWTSYAWIDLPKGFYVVHAKLDTYMPEMLGSSHWAVVNCRLRGKDAGGAETTIDAIRTEVGDDGNERAAMSLMSTWYDDNGGDRIKLQCQSDGSWSDMHPTIGNIKLMTQDVGGYNVAAN